MKQMKSNHVECFGQHRIMIHKELEDLGSDGTECTESLLPMLCWQLAALLNAW